MTRNLSPRNGSSGPRPLELAGRTTLFAIPDLNLADRPSQAAMAPMEPPARNDVANVQTEEPAIPSGAAVDPSIVVRSAELVGGRNEVAPSRQEPPVAEPVVLATPERRTLWQLSEITRFATSSWRRKLVSGSVGLVIAYSLLASVTRPQGDGDTADLHMELPTVTTGAGSDPEPLGPLRVATSPRKPAPAVQSPPAASQSDTNTDQLIFQVPRLRPQAPSFQTPVRERSAAATTSEGLPLRRTEDMTSGVDPGARPVTARTDGSPHTSLVSRSSETPAGRPVAASAPLDREPQTSLPQYEVTDPSRYQDPEYDIRELAERRRSTPR